MALRAVEPGGVSWGTPDRPGVAALLEALAVRRHARCGLAAGVAVATLAFGLSAYLPGTEESLVYWAGMSVVLAAGVAGLVTVVLVLRAVRRRTPANRGAPPANVVAAGAVAAIASLPLAAASGTRVPSRRRLGTYRCSWARYPGQALWPPTPRARPNGNPFLPSTGRRRV